MARWSSAARPRHSPGWDVRAGVPLVSQERCSAAAPRASATRPHPAAPAGAAPRARAPRGRRNGHARGRQAKGAPSDDAEEEEEEEEEQLDEESKGWLGTIKDVLFSSKREKVEAHAVERDESRDVKMLILGFDGTLTMAGYIDPNTTTRVEMTSRNYADFRLKSKDEHVWNLGGAAQIEALKDLFEKLQDFDIELRILSLGTKRAIMYALGLPEVGLLKFFSDDAAGKNGARIWGGDTPPERRQGVQGRGDRGVDAGARAAPRRGRRRRRRPRQHRHARQGQAQPGHRALAREGPRDPARLQPALHGRHDADRRGLCGLVDLDAEGEARRARRRARRRTDRQGKLPAELPARAWRRWEHRWDLPASELATREAPRGAYGVYPLCVGKFEKLKLKKNF